MHEVNRYYLIMTKMIETSSHIKVISVQKEKERYFVILIVSGDNRQLCGQSRPVELPIVDLDGKEVNAADTETFSFINIAAYYTFTTSILGSPPNSTAEVPGLLLPLLPARGPGFFRTLLFFLQKKLELPPTVPGFHFFLHNFVPKVTLAQSGMGLASVEQEWSWILPNLVVKDQVIS